VSDSLAKQISRLSVEEQRAWLDSLEDELREELALSPWWLIARPEQLPPEGDWSIWLLQSGRRWGKTATGSENLLQAILDTPVDASGTPTEWGIFAPTFADARAVCVEGPSGLLNALRRRPGVEFTYDKSKWRITFKTGQVVHLFGASDEDKGRGFTFSGVWADELAKWPYAQKTWEEAISPAISNRLPNGKEPRAIVTTTPKPAHVLLKRWAHASYVHRTLGAIDENKDNLSPKQLAELHELYDGTRIGRQELYGELIEDVEGALWLYENILLWRGPLPEIRRTVVAIDPAITNTENSDETGISVASLCESGELIVRADRTVKSSIKEWADKAIAAFYEFEAERIVYEDNQGGDAWKTIIHDIDPYIRVEKVNAGGKSKGARAEPIASLYEQHKVWHMAHFDKLEGQMTTWEPYDKKQKSPDRVDALVYALTELNPSGSKSRFISELMDFCPNPACGQANAKGSPLCAHCHRPMAV
jgi:phage terminase large subunit-like protein